MIEALRPIEGINTLILLMVIWLFIRVVRSESNTVVWADFISTRDAEGKQRGDLNKVGQLVGIIVASVSVLMYADNKNVEPTGLSVLLLTALAYLGAVTMYASFLRSKRGTVETTRTTEPSQTPSKVTEKTVETAPVAPKT